MLVKNETAPVVGNVCMDMTMIDITDKNLKEGDEVIVFGEGLPVKKLAEWAETIPYEILTGIGPRVKRIYFEQP
jgi:alanine racemase